MLTKEELSLATSLWPLQREHHGKLKELNKFQKDALDIAYNNGFTLIQGPPGISPRTIATTHACTLKLEVNYPVYTYWLSIGTGKTVTGAHLAYVLANKLRKEQLSSKSSQQQSVASGSINMEELRPCVMYCGPSNQAVNVVLSK